MRIHSLIGVFTLIAVSAYSQSFNSLHWVTDDFSVAGGDAFATPDLVTPGNMAVTTTDNWVVQMYSTALATVTSPSDGVALAAPFQGTAAFGVNGTFASFSLNHSSIAGLNVFSVIYNSTSIGTATQYAIIDGVAGNHTTFVVPGFDNLAGNPGEYNAGVIIASDWQAVVIPEPSTCAMILCGIGLLVFRRFRKA